MKKQRTVIALIAIIVILFGAVGYRAMALHKEDGGRSKFNKVIAELRQDKQFDNPCLGTAVLRTYSFSELNEKSVAEIKALAKIDPYSC